MMTSNNALVPDTDKEDTIASTPFEWPMLWNGMRMNGWSDMNLKYYLVGNAVVWWSSTMSLVVFLFTLLYHFARFQRKINDFAPGRLLHLSDLAFSIIDPAFLRAGEWNQFLYVSKIAALGWLFHYIPFLIMVCLFSACFPLSTFADF